MHPDVVISSSNESTLVIVISMNEEIPVPVTIANLVGYSGIDPPTLNEFSIGSNSSLGIYFTQTDELIWQVVIGQKQDYENPSMRYYTFTLNEIDGIHRPYISLSLKNIFDNYPIVNQITNQCVVPVSIQFYCIYSPLLK